MRLIYVFLGAALAVFGPMVQAAELSGRRAPGFALPDVNMQYHDLADYQGKVVLLEIMQSQCPNCQTLVGILAKAKEKYGDRVAVLGVVTPPDNTQTIRKFIEDYQVKTPVLFDCGQMVGSYLLPNPQNPRIHVPHLFLIDSKGIIRNDFDSASATVQDGSGLEAAIDRVLADREAEGAP